MRDIVNMPQNKIRCTFGPKKKEILCFFIMLLDVSLLLSLFHWLGGLPWEKNNMVIFNFNTITIVWIYSTCVCLMNWKPLLYWIIAYNLLQIVLHSPPPHQIWNRLMRKIHFLALVTQHKDVSVFFEVLVVIRVGGWWSKKDYLMHICLIFCCFILVYTAWNWDHFPIFSVCGKLWKASLVA